MVSAIEDELYNYFKDVKKQSEDPLHEIGIHPFVVAKVRERGKLDCVS